jgi:ubiquinone/menaquinone biosynthesis C-methylase UbiE
MQPSVDYDKIAGLYDLRYQRFKFEGVERALDEFIPNQPHTKVLEVGCGTGYWLGLLSKRGLSVAGLDASQNMLERASARVPGADLRLGTAEDLPWSDATFDRVVCINALHHFPDKLGFIRETFRVLAPAGAFMCVTLDPHTKLDRWYVYEYFTRTLNLDEQRYPSEAELRGSLGAAGFEKVARREVQHWTSEIPVDEAFARGLLTPAYSSQLALLTDQELAEGVDRVRRDMDAARARGDVLRLSADLRLYAVSGVKVLSGSCGGARVAGRIGVADLRTRAREEAGIC